MDVVAAMKALEAAGSEATRRASVRHGVAGAQFGVSHAALARLVKQAGSDTALARELWKTGNHDARVLATMVADGADAADRRARSVGTGGRQQGGLRRRRSARRRSCRARKRRSSSWTKSPDEWIGRAGWMGVAAMASAPVPPPETELEGFISSLEKGIHRTKNHVKDAQALPPDRDRLAVRRARGPGARGRASDRPDRRRPRRHRVRDARPALVHPEGSRASACAGAQGGARQASRGERRHARRDRRRRDRAEGGCGAASEDGDRARGLDRRVAAGAPCGAGARDEALAASRARAPGSDRSCRATRRFGRPRNFRRRPPPVRSAARSPGDPREAPRVPGQGAVPRRRPPRPARPRGRRPPTTPPPAFTRTRRPARGRQGADPRRRPRQGRRRQARPDRRPRRRSVAASAPRQAASSRSRRVPRARSSGACSSRRGCPSIASSTPPSCSTGASRRPS